MSRRAVWVHLLAARAGGGQTYLQALLEHLEVPDVGRPELVLLVPEGTDVRAEGVLARAHGWTAAAHWRRVVFDQLILPAMLLAGRPASLYGAGNFVPVLAPCPTEVLLRDTRYFDDEFLRRQSRRERVRLGLMRWLMLAGVRRSRVVHYPSQAMRDLVERRHPWLADRGRVSPYGAPAFTGNHPRARSSGRSLLFVGSLTAQKNLTVVIHAFGQLDGVRLRCTVSADRLLAHAAELGVLAEVGALLAGGNIDAVGTLSRDQLAAAYAEADALLMASTTESFCHPLVEAMAAGTSILAADRPFAHEACGPCARYFDPLDPDALVRCIEEWDGEPTGTDDERRAQLSRYSWIDHWHSVLGRRRSG